MGKAKPAKHTTAEIKAKVHAATTNMGGGKAGLQVCLCGDGVAVCTAAAVCVVRASTCSAG
jgi:hypothetical protein